MTNTSTFVQPHIHPVSSFEGNADEVNSLFLFGGRWFAPNRAFRRVLGNFSESLIRTVLGNSSNPPNPATISDEHAEILQRVCDKARKSGVDQRQAMPTTTGKGVR